MSRQLAIGLITLVAVIISIIVTSALFYQKLMVIETMKAHGDSGAGLKVVVKIKYSDYIKEHGIGKAYFHFYDDSDDVSKTKDLSKKFPKSVTLKFPSGAVDVGEGFTVILNSYVCDDATQKEGINSPKKSPETVKMRFPC